ncbi:MAG: hypothetical protein ACREBA_07395, partial [Nitrosotalea sp.]
MTDSKLKNEIRKHYLAILEREPDPGGLEFYYNKIKNNEINLELLPGIFRNSPEYEKLQQRKNGTSIQSKDPTPTTNYIVEKNIDGHTLSFDSHDKILLETFSKDEYEKATTDAVKKLVKKGMNVINIGANIGYF